MLDADAREILFRRIRDEVVEQSHYALDNGYPLDGWDQEHAGESSVVAHRLLNAAIAEWKARKEAT